MILFKHARQSFDPECNAREFEYIFTYALKHFKDYVIIINDWFLLFFNYEIFINVF